MNSPTSSSASNGSENKALFENMQVVVVVLNIEVLEDSEVSFQDSKLDAQNTSRMTLRAAWIVVERRSPRWTVAVLMNSTVCAVKRSMRS